MSRAISIAGVRPLVWLARVRAQRSCSARACPAAQLLGAGAAGLAPRARGTALGMGARETMRQRSGPGQRLCRRIPLRDASRGLLGPLQQGPLRLLQHKERTARGIWITSVSA